MEPAGDIASLRSAHRHVDALRLPANQEIVLDGIEGSALEIAASIDPQDAPMIEMSVLRSPGKGHPGGRGGEFTRIAFYPRRGVQNWRRFAGWGQWESSCNSLIVLDTSYSSELPDVLSRAPETAPVYLEPGEPLHLRVFIDRSVVEVFVNGQQCVASRVYPGRPESIGVSLRSQGRDAKLTSLDAWQMNSIYASTLISIKSTRRLSS